MKKYTLDNDNTKKKTGIEVLRVLAMLWIIMFHYADHGMIDMLESPLCINWIILAFSRIGGGYWELHICADYRISSS